MIERLVRTSVLAAVSLLLLAPPVLAQDPEREPDADASAKRPLTREQVLRKNPVDPLALHSPVPEMRWLAEQVAAGTTDMRMLRSYWRLSNELFPHDKVPPADLRDRALAAKTALEGCRGSSNAVPLATGFWVPLGPINIPGRMTAVAFHPTDPNTVFAGAAGGGVWKTTDLGQNWTPLSDAQATLAIGGLDVDPVDPNIIYAGLGEGNYAIDNLYGNGMLKSTDGGANWTLHPMLTSGGQPVRYFHEVKIDPNNRTRVWGATRSGLYLSTDSGVNWTEVSGGLPVIDTTSVLPSSKPGSSVVLAGVGGSFGNAASGFFRSTDGGASWTAIAGMPAGGATGRIIFAQSKSNPDRIYAAMHENAGHSVQTYYRSDDEGATFTAVGRPNTTCNGQCWYNLSLAVDAGNPDVLFSGQVSLYRSTNAGMTWARVSSTGGPETYVHVDHHWLSSPAPGKMLAASDGGVYLSNDQGATWDFTGLKLLTGQYYHMTTHPLDDNYAIGGTQDNGTHRFAGTMSFDQVIGGDGAWTAIDWVDPVVWYGSYIYLSMYRSRASGAGFVGLPMTGVDPNEPVAFIAPFALDRGNPSTIFGCTSRLYRSTDQGDTWTAISPQLPAASNRYINAVDNCRDVPATIWAGTNDGKVWYTPDGGTNWNDVTGTLPVRAVTSIAVHPTLPGTAYLTLAGTGTGHVWKTTDSGASWSDVSAGLPDITHRHVLLIPDQPSTLVVATDLGVYRSDDAGQSWYVYGSDLPNVAVNWLGFSTATGMIRAATHGRGMWQLVPANTCPFVPDFGGLQSITVVSVGGECKPQLNWQPATVTCSLAPGISYNVYRSTDPLFTPGPASLLQAGVSGVSYRDLAALPGVPYYYVVKAEDSQTGFPGPANGGKEDLNRRTALIELGDPFASGSFRDPGGDGNAWMQSNYWSVDNLGNTTPAGQFSYRSSPGRSPAYTVDACAAIETPDMVLGPAATLTYQASYNIEYQWDGVVVEVSTDRGANWIDVPPAGGYPSDLSQTQGNGCNMPAARPVFNGPVDNASLVPFQLYTHDLAAYAGQTARIRFVLTTDGGAEFEGFLLDDIAVTPAAGTGAGCGCATNPTTVVANRLLVGQQANGNPRFVWTSLEPTGTWNLHSTADPTQIGTLYSNGASVVSAGATVKSIDDDGSFPLGYYQIYGADCTGTSVP